MRSKLIIKATTILTLSFYLSVSWVSANEESSDSIDPLAGWDPVYDWADAYVDELRYLGCAESIYYSTVAEPRDPPLIVTINNYDGCISGSNERYLHETALGVTYGNKVKGFESGPLNHPELEIRFQCSDDKMINFVSYSFHYPLDHTRENVLKRGGEYRFKNPARIDNETFELATLPYLGTDKIIPIPVVSESSNFINEIPLGFVQEFEKQINFATKLYKMANPTSFPSCCLAWSAQQDPDSGCEGVN